MKKLLIIGLIGIYFEKTENGWKGKLSVLDQEIHFFKVCDACLTLR
jgi:hypothetical protein